MHSMCSFRKWLRFSKNIIIFVECPVQPSAIFNLHFVHTHSHALMDGGVPSGNSQKWTEKFSDPRDNNNKPTLIIRYVGLWFCLDWLLNGHDVWYTAIELLRSSMNWSCSTYCKHASMKAPLFWSNVATALGRHCYRPKPPHHRQSVSRPCSFHITSTW